MSTLHDIGICIYICIFSLSFSLSHSLSLSLCVCACLSVLVSCEVKKGMHKKNFGLCKKTALFERLKQTRKRREKDCKKIRDNMSTDDERVHEEGMEEERDSASCSCSDDDYDDYDDD